MRIKHTRHWWVCLLSNPVFEQQSTGLLLATKLTGLKSAYSLSDAPPMSAAHEKPTSVQKILPVHTKTLDVQVQLPPNSMPKGVFPLA